MAPTRRGQVPVVLECGAKRVFASVLDWPGWCRSGKTEEAALEALAAYQPRFAPITAAAGHPLPEGLADRFTVVERVTGDATTDFGAPGKVTDAERAPLTAAEAKRFAALLGASWDALDRVAATAPAELRKGPRGGGRDRDAVVAHVVAAEAAYARKIGVRMKTPAGDDADAVAALREAIAQVITASRAGEPPVEKGWPPRYAARRIAWHVLDHVWEIEDRSTPG